MTNMQSKIMSNTVNGHQNWPTSPTIMCVNVAKRLYVFILTIEILCKTYKFVHQLLYNILHYDGFFKIKAFRVLLTAYATDKVFLRGQKLLLQVV